MVWCMIDWYMVKKLAEKEHILFMDTININWWVDFGISFPAPEVAISLRITKLG